MALLERAQRQNGLGSCQAPPLAFALHAVLDHRPTRRLHDAGRDGQARGQVPVVRHPAPVVVEARDDFREGSALQVMLFLENTLQVIFIFNGLRIHHCQRALLGYHYPINVHSWSVRSVGYGFRGSIPQSYPKSLTRDKVFKHALRQPRWQAVARLKLFPALSQKRGRF